MRVPGGGLRMSLGKRLCEWDVSERSLGRFPCSRHATKTKETHSEHSCVHWERAYALTTVKHAQWIVIDLPMIR